MNNFKLDNSRFDINEKVVSCSGKEVNDLDNISAELLNYTPLDVIESYVPELAVATWTHDVNEFRATITDEDKTKLMKLFWEGKCIPTAMGSIQITVLLRGITTHDVTHIIRHSGLRFAADCTGDKYIENRPIIVPSFFEDIDKSYKERYVKIMKESYQLYDDLCNNCKHNVHVQDARLVLPRTLETFYYITGSLLDFTRMLKQRLDMQFQPKSDNIWALRIYEAIKQVYPDYYINLHARNNFYCGLAKDNAVLSSNWYNPLPQDKDEYTDKLHTNYGDMTKMAGYSKYKEILDKFEEKYGK